MNKKDFELSTLPVYTAEEYMSILDKELLPDAEPYIEFYFSNGLISGWTKENTSSFDWPSTFPQDKILFFSMSLYLYELYNIITDSFLPFNEYSVYQFNAKDKRDNDEMISIIASFNNLKQLILQKKEDDLKIILDNFNDYTNENFSMGRFKNDVCDTLDHLIHNIDMVMNDKKVLMILGV